MGRRRSELTEAIDDAIDLVKRSELDCTPATVRRNVRMTPAAFDAARDRGLDDAIARRLKGRGEIIVDAVPREGGRPRGGYWGTGLSEHQEQLRIQAENGRYTQNKIAAENAVCAFMKQRTTELGYEPPWVTIAEDVVRIYAMHDAAPPEGSA